MYDVEKRSAILEDAAGFARRDAYIYVRSRNKLAALGYVYTLGKQTSHSPERCTAQNATGARFLQVQIHPRVLVYDWDPLVPCVKS